LVANHWFDGETLHNGIKILMLRFTRIIWCTRYCRRINGCTDCVIAFTKAITPRTYSCELQVSPLRGCKFCTAII